MATLQLRASRLSAFFTCALAAILGASAASSASAQAYAHLDLGGNIEVGGEAERYSRLLQLAGLVPLTPVSIQPFSPVQVYALRPAQGRAHPWAERFKDLPNGKYAGLLRPSGRVIENTAFPYQISGGPTWAGRGLTGELQWGGLANWGPLYAQLAPIGSVTQNSAFSLAANGQSGDLQFGDPRYPIWIDAPQRFGSSSFTRGSIGSSSLVADAFHVVLGLSSSPQRWGPQLDYPLVLGPNAGGFPTAYAGTDRPLDLWLFKAHTRLLYGRLTQSAFAPPTQFDSVRLGEGLVFVVEPRWLTGLEVGLGRFIHLPWSERSLSELKRPFSGGVNNFNRLNNNGENQMASVFARWALPAARSEFYGEYYKEDFAGSFHQGTGSLVELPDDLASFSLGFQTLLVKQDDVMRVLRGELVNGETSPVQRLERGFIAPLPPYYHTQVVQGHTFNGLILGSPDAYGGSGWTLAVDQITPRGRVTLGLQRSLRLDWLPTDTTARHPDVSYSVRAEVLRFRGTRDFGVTLVPTYELNRNLIEKKDAFNLTIGFTARGW